MRTEEPGRPLQTGRTMQAVDVFTPIPEEALHRTPKAFRVAGTFVRIVLLLITAALVVRFAFEAPPPDFRDFGVIQTQVGVAEVACGGDLTRCGDTTALVFPSCSLSAPWNRYFPRGATNTDALVRNLIGKRPPSGPRWDVTCRDGYPLGSKTARLKSL